MSVIRYFSMMPFLLFAAHTAAQRPSVCLALHLAGVNDAPVNWGAVHHPPDTIAIDSSAFFRRTGTSFVIRPTADAHKRSGRGQAVRDSLFMSWFNALAGVAVRGSVQDSTYRGVAILLTDAVTSGPPQEARVQGVRVPCPAGLR
jgi:hypothetical protein